MILVDTSSWIHFLRPQGDPEVRSRVDAALRAGQACWCPPVQLELWNGARGAQEHRVLRHFARTLPEVPIDEGVWQAAYDLARRARARGVSEANLTQRVTAPAADVLIAACARRHGASLEYADSDFDLLEPVE
ncbi:MAG: PIN domain-containing protein [Spirochaetaceae bacterium]|nr:PIN domain-containing protein [Spirochaetaceae bacterium]